MVFIKNLDRFKNLNLLIFTFNEIRKFFSFAKKKNQNNYCSPHEYNKIEL